MSFFLFFFNQDINSHLNLKPSGSQIDNDGLASNFPSTRRCTVDKSKVEIDFKKRKTKKKAVSQSKEPPLNILITDTLKTRPRHHTK